MKKQPIVILDEGFQGINIFNGLSRIYKNEEFVYVNDYLNYPYEGKEEEAIQRYVNNKLDFIKLLNPKGLIIANSVIVEYANNVFVNLGFPVYKIDEAIINFISKEYDQKNIALVAPESVIKANIYQKNFRYNHLYAIFSDELEKVITLRKVKTSTSFSKMKEACKFILSKDVDIFLMVDSIIENLYTEINEYVKTDRISNMTDIINNHLLEKGIEFYQKGKGKRFVYSDLNEKEFKEKSYWIDMKYSFMTIEKKNILIEKMLNKIKLKEEKKKQKENSK